MKLDRIIWGVILLFVGSVILLDNFNIINFSWSSLWDYWPVFLIITGVSIIFNKSEGQLGKIITIFVLFFGLGFLFFIGQRGSRHERSERGGDRVEFRYHDEDDNDTLMLSDEKVLFVEPMPADSIKEATLNLSGGGVSYKIKDVNTDSLFVANVDQHNSQYALSRKLEGQTAILDFKMKDKTRNLDNIKGDEVAIMLSKKPEWNLDLNMGASAADFDLSGHRVRKINFNGGAASLDIKLGASLPITDVKIESGIASIKIEIPQEVACQITTQSGLSSNSFPGFDKISKNIYRTPGYDKASKKIFIELDGGLSSFKVKRYP